MDRGVLSVKMGEVILFVPAQWQQHVLAAQRGLKGCLSLKGDKAGLIQFTEQRIDLLATGIGIFLLIVAI